MNSILTKDLPRSDAAEQAGEADVSGRWHVGERGLPFAFSPRFANEGRIFVDDIEQELIDGWNLEIHSGGSLVKFQRIEKGYRIIGDISAPCSFRFKGVNEEAQFDNVGAHLFRCGGDLLVNPACMAGVLTSRPNFNARCCLTKT